jgi:hypothetical protein
MSDEENTIVRMTKLSCAGLLSLLLAGVAAQAQDATPLNVDPALSRRNTGAIEVKVRDSATGRNLAETAAIEVEEDGVQPNAKAIARAAGRGQKHFEMAPGEKRIKIAKPGYRAIHTKFKLQRGERLPVKVLLDPVELPTELQPEVVASKIQPGKAMLHGHLTDEASGEPVKGATVRLEQQNVSAQTDDKGYFVLYGALPVGVRAAEALPTTDTLALQAAGFKSLRLFGVSLNPGATHFVLELEIGKGVVEKNITHKLITESLLNKK